MVAKRVKRAKKPAAKKIAKARVRTPAKAMSKDEIAAARREAYKGKVSVAFRVNKTKHRALTKAAKTAALSLDAWCNKITDEAIERSKQTEQVDLEDAINEAPAQEAA